MAAAGENDKKAKMDEYSDYNPQYCIEGVTFRFYSSEEIKALSVKEIKNPETFNNLSQPNFGGLYDPALGPTERDDACATCGQSQLHCPGHMGHIELPLIVFNPVFFNTLYKILKSSCYECHRINVQPLLVHLFVNQCQLLDHGKISAVGDLEEVYSQTMHDRVDKAEMDQLCRETVTQFTENAVKDAPDVDVLVKNVEALRHKLVTEFVRDQIRRAGKCVHCQARIRPVKQEHHAKIVLMGKLKENIYETPRKYFSQDKEELPPLPKSDDSDEGFEESNQGGEPRAKRPKLSDTTPGKKHDVTLLTPQMIRDHMREVWNQDAVLLKRLYSSLATSPAEKPVDIFFLDIVPVPPSRFRPVNVMKGLKYENAQTANLNKVLKSAVVVRELLWEIEKSIAKTPSEEVSSSVLSHVPGKTLAEKLNNAWVRLQTQVNCIFDSELDKLSKDVNPGIKQLLEKKEGLFRKNMMGKRVNYAARSVISPDPNINTCEIGIPEVFATTLTYPQPVTPWNVQELRQMVINGPKKHPGAFMVVNEDGSKVFLDAKKKIQREAIAKQLLKPSTSHSKVTTGIKKVYRHLKNGDVLLINRQPTLHRPSIQAHKARVLPREKTLRLHYANCKAYNADFDGDEMNAHFPQNEIARAEAYNIASTDFQYLVPKDGTPLAGLIQDHMVSGVSLTIRGRVFSKQDYCKLVYAALVDKNSPVKLLPPTILKPHRLWSGKQVLSTVVLNVIPDDKPPLSLTGRAKVPEKTWIKVHKGTSLEATPAYMGESDVIIRQGELLCGVLDKGHYGPTPFGLVHSCYELYGGAIAGKMLACFGRLFMNFLQIRGFTLGVEDILVTKSADKRRTRIIRKSPYCGSVAASKVLDLDPMVDDATLKKALKSAHFNTDDRQMREIDMAMRNQTNEIQNQIVNVTMPAGLEKLFPDNNLQLMVVSGAKGSSVNCMQISCLLGQIELEGKRPPPMLSGKTLPSFLPYDVTPRAGGFVTGRFLTGIKQQEYFFHCMAGREGLIDTAVKTSRSGYLQRCLIKHLEGVKVNYDLTVRDGDSSIIQFYYGEDGLDITKTGYLTPKQFPFLLENRHIVHREEPDVETETKKVKKLLSQIKKWHKKNHAEPGFRLRTSGFLKFCQSAILDVAMETDDVSTPGRTDEDSWKCRSWYQLSEKQRQKYSKTTGVCPSPVLSCVSPYSTSAIPEKLDSVIKNYSSHHLHQHCPSMPSSQFHNLISSKVKRSLVEPGEAVGLLCAQSIGEPSTQMTLNTFHFAGRGEMNVTLGIPRLREILMVGSRNIKTPAMDVPVKLGARDDAKKLQKQFNKVYLSDVIKDIKVSEYLAITGRTKIHRRRVFRVTFTFLPKACYKERFVLTPKDIITFMETRYIKKLVSLIKKRINAMTKLRLLSSGTDKTVRMTAQPSGDGEECGDEGGSDEEEEIDGDDGDAAAAKQRSKKNEEREYDNDEGNVNFDDEETNQEDVEMDDLDQGGNLGDDLVEEVGTVIEDDIDVQSQEAVNARINAVLQLAMEVEKYSYDTKKNLWCEMTLSFPLADSKIDLLALVEKDIKKVVVHEVSGISRCFLGDQPGPHVTEFHLKTEGINMHELYKYDQILDLNRLYSNDIHAIADTYGIEAASKVIIKEIQSVFAAYGIEVDYRHLSLLSDYMTFEGTYKPLNRISMESNPSPLQKMSFETTVHFLVNSSINAGIDNLSSPSAQIVLGKVVSSGTGSHELMNPLITL